jgi:hypothetical protein
MWRILRYTWVLIVLGGIFLGWTFYSRKAANSEFTERLQERKSSNEQKTIDAYGGDKLTILSFYGIPAIIQKGSAAQLCYGVSNAKDVRIDPPVELVWPSLNRCVDVSPIKDTEYTLIAIDDKGNKKTANLVIKVK